MVANPRTQRNRVLDLWPRRPPITNLPMTRGENASEYLNGGKILQSKAVETPTGSTRSPNSIDPETDDKLPEPRNPGQEWTGLRA